MPSGFGTSEGGTHAAPSHGTSFTPAALSVSTGFFSSTGGRRRRAFSTAPVSVVSVIATTAATGFFSSHGFSRRRGFLAARRRGFLASSTLVLIVLVVVVVVVVRRSFQFGNPFIPFFLRHFPPLRSQLPVRLCQGKTIYIQLYLTFIAVVLSALLDKVLEGRHVLNLLLLFFFVVVVSVFCTCLFLPTCAFARFRIVVIFKLFLNFVVPNLLFLW
mmetsp:Transcript_5031/g.7895  ORF Transcript_5031/g.7895 Transcript_5031/m.7895 type:complete len:216 (-) Transcript_5031:103-750(-)